MKMIQDIRFVFASLMVCGAVAAHAAQKGESSGMTYMEPQQEKQQPAQPAQGPDNSAMIFTTAPQPVPQQQNVPQVDQAPVAPSQGDAGPGGPSPIVEPEPAQTLPAGFRGDDHLLDDQDRIGEIGEAGRVVPDAQFQDTVRDLFGSADAVETGKGQGGKLGDFMGDVEMDGFGIPGQDDAAGAAASSAAELSGRGKYATGQRSFSSAGQNILRARLNQITDTGWTLVSPPSERGGIAGEFTDRGTGIGPLSRDSSWAQPNITEVSYSAYNDETGQFMRFRFREATGQGIYGQETVYYAEETQIFDIVNGRASDRPKETFYNHWDENGQQTFHNTRRSDEKPEKPSNEGGSSTAASDGGKDTSTSSSSDSGGKDTASSDTDDDTSDSGKDTASSEDTGTDDAGTESGKDAAADAGTKELSGGTTGGDDPRGGDTAAGTPADLPGLSQGAGVMQFHDMRNVNLVDRGSLVADPDAKQQGSGGGGLMPAPRGIGPGARPGDAGENPDAPRMKIDPDDLVTDPIPDDLDSGPAGQ